MWRGGMVGFNCALSETREGEGPGHSSLTLMNTPFRRSRRGSGRPPSARWTKKSGWRCRHWYVAAAIVCLDFFLSLVDRRTNGTPPKPHVVQVKRKESNLIMDNLHDVGASDILLFPISNSRM